MQIEIDLELWIRYFCLPEVSFLIGIGALPTDRKSGTEDEA